jgi:hypothetical protein
LAIACPSSHSLPVDAAAALAKPRLFMPLFRAAYTIASDAAVPTIERSFLRRANRFSQQESCVLPPEQIAAWTGALSPLSDRACARGHRGHAARD